MLIGSIHSDMNNPHIFYHLECTTGAKRVVKKFIRAIRNTERNARQHVGTEDPTILQNLWRFQLPKLVKGTYSSELGLTMTTRALNKFGVKRIGVKLQQLKVKVHQILKQIAGHLLDRVPLKFKIN